MDSISYIILFFLSLSGFFLSIRFKNLSIISTLILVTAILKFSNTNLFDSLLKPINSFNTYSIVLFMLAFLFYFKEIKNQSHNLFLAVIAIFSVNTFIIFFIAYELFFSSSYLLNSKQNVTKSFINLYYFSTLLLGLFFYKYFLSNDVLFIIFAYLIILLRFIYFLFLKDLKFEGRFFSIVNAIIISNLFFNNSSYLVNKNISMLFFTILTVFIFINSITFLKQKNLTKTYIINCYVLTSIVLVIFRIDYYFLLFSFFVLFVLLKFVQDIQIKYRIIFVQLFFTFIYDLEVLKRLLFELNFVYVFIFIAGLVLYKVKIFIYLEKYFSELFIRFCK